MVRPIALGQWRAWPALPASMRAAAVFCSALFAYPCYRLAVCGAGAAVRGWHGQPHQRTVATHGRLGGKR